MRIIKITISLVNMFSLAFMQECPPDTISINPMQNIWEIPSENHWNEIEVMTWNIKNFPISNNTIP